MNWNILGVLALVSLISMSFVFGGEIDFTLEALDANVMQYNEEVPTDWQHLGERQVAVGSTHYVNSSGELVSNLNDGVIYTSTIDGNLLLTVNSINESSCNLFAEVSGISYPLDVVETKVLSVAVGQKFGLKFTQTSYGDHCQINFDLNRVWVEVE